MLELLYNTNTATKEQKMSRWQVYRNGFHLDTVFFLPECDAEYVRKSLINHDGYPYNIIVKKG